MSCTLNVLFQCLGNKSQKYHTLNKRLDFYSYNLLNNCYNFVQQWTTKRLLM